MGWLLEGFMLVQCLYPIGGQGYLGVTQDFFLLPICISMTIIYLMICALYDEVTLAYHSNAIEGQLCPQRC